MKNYIKVFSETTKDREKKKESLYVRCEKIIRVEFKYEYYENNEDRKRYYKRPVVIGYYDNYGMDQASVLKFVIPTSTPDEIYDLATMLGITSEEVSAKLLELELRKDE